MGVTDRQHNEVSKMTRATKLLATTAALALGGAVVAGASLAGAGWDRSHGGHHGGFGGDHLFESFDVNDDGILTQTRSRRSAKAASPSSMPTATAA
jgi:hypothetical protein